MKGARGSPPLHLALKAGFNQDQPRDDHGRWTDTGGGTRIAQVEGAGRYSVRLADEEARGGHAIRTHVGKSDAELLATLRAMRIDTPFVTIAKDAQGSFASLESANDFVNRVLESHAPMVDLVASGAMKEVWLPQRFGYPTGREAFRPDAFAEPYMRPTYEVGVLIRHDRHPLTAWLYGDHGLPSQRETGEIGGLHEYTEGVRLSGRVFLGWEPCRGKYTRRVGGNAVRMLNPHQKAVVKPFIEDVLRRDLPDKELNRIWVEGAACLLLPRHQ